MRHAFHFRSCIALPILAIAGLSCQSGSSSREANQSTDTVATTTGPAQPDYLCFRDILNRDTTTVHLVVNGNRVSGLIDINPYEKDRARGPFVGTRTGNAISADWQRSGEGITETYALTLTLSGDSISWREGERIQQQGKWVLKQPGGTYRYALAKTSCR